MIITKEKPIEEIYAMLEPYKKILVLGCSGCFQPPRRLKEANVRLEKLESKKKFEAKSANVSRQCDDDVVRKTIGPLTENDKFDAILSLACGVGVQTVAEIYDLPVFPAQNTLFMGAKIGDNYEEKCAGCGDCLLGYTGGYCPIANCAKSLVNGPCGGPINGKCEYGDYTKPCAWIQIFKRLNSRPGGLELFKKFRTPANFKIRNPPRQSKIEVSKVE